MKNKWDHVTCRSFSSGRPFLVSHVLMCLSVQRGLPYFLWCCFCRAASDNCPWRISLLCLSISPSIRAKAWEPMKERSTPKPSSSSSWLSATQILSIEIAKLDSKCYKQTVNAAIGMSAQKLKKPGLRLFFENETEIRFRHLKNWNNERNHLSMWDGSFRNTWNQIKGT